MSRVIDLEKIRRQRAELYDRPEPASSIWKGLGVAFMPSIAIWAAILWAFGVI